MEDDPRASWPCPECGGETIWNGPTTRKCVECGNVHEPGEEVKTVNSKTDTKKLPARRVTLFREKGGVMGAVKTVPEMFKVIEVDNCINPLPRQRLDAASVQQLIEDGYSVKIKG